MAMTAAEDAHYKDTHTPSPHDNTRIVTHITALHSPQHTRTHSHTHTGPSATIKTQLENIRAFPFSSDSSVTMYITDSLHSSSSEFVKRQFYGGYYNNRYYGSGWYNYGRWILLGVIVGVAILFWLIICGCNRRRTRRGYGPVKYTGWATPGFSHAQQTGTAQGQYPMQNTNTYQPNQAYNYNQPSGGYPNPNNTYASNQTYYNAPTNAPPQYGGDQTVYQPPTSAAPAREK